MQNLKILFFLCCVFIFSCEEVVKETNLFDEIGANQVHFAEWFSIQKINETDRLLTIRINSDQENSSVQQYLLSPFPEQNKNLPKGITVIKTPIQKIVVTSTVHVAMLEKLGGLATLVGFPSTPYLCSPSIKKEVEANNVIELGKTQQINLELLFGLHPDVFVGSDFSEESKRKGFLNEAGINVLINNDWQEKTLLGKSEWIKFFGVLLGKEKEALNFFNKLKDNYLTLKKKKIETPKKTVMGGTCYQGIWYMPMGNSWVAQLIKDAKGVYPWQDIQGTASFQASTEEVLEKAIETEFLIFPVFLKNKKELLELSVHYKKFKAFKNNNIYALKQNNCYFEISSLYPNLVLKDFMKIMHPDLFPEYILSFYEKKE